MGMRDTQLYEGYCYIQIAFLIHCGVHIPFASDCILLLFTFHAEASFLLHHICPTKVNLMLFPSSCLQVKEATDWCMNRIPMFWVSFFFSF